ncbi:hypothetical protein MAR_013023 [Mya arenaria]|uniref:Uncharacterized protein n=1 Tax=Mya arenaria TaxID=6604 RepID=A0ABY7G247_MYAAR|nr:hypothetical protein MAR_013023 [Mya arenaria]
MHFQTFLHEAVTEGCFVTGVQTVDSSQAACDLSTLTSEATQNCFNGFSTYINQAMSSVSDPSQMATVFCSPLRKSDEVRSQRFSGDQHGLLKEQVDCVTTEVEEQCTEITDQIKQMVTMMNTGLPDGIVFPEYDVLKTFIRTGCTNVPEDMATNKCARDHLESAALKECMTKANADFKTPMEMKSCGATDARLICLKESVEKPCGKSYYTALATKGDHFLTMHIFTCDRSTSAAPVVRLSAAASLVVVAAVLLL